jgi:hypothetical protein
MSEQSDKLHAALVNIWSSDFVQKNPSSAYKKQYPSEYAALAEFINGGDDPGDVFRSKLGRGQADIERIVRELAGVTPPQPTVPGRWFADNSPWNTPAAGLGKHPKSDVWMARIRSLYGNINLNLGGYTTAVWKASPSWAKQDHWQPNNWFLDDVPAPPNWHLPAPPFDTAEHCDAIVDEDAGIIWQFINLKRDTSKPGKHWTEAAGGATKLDGSGFWDNYANGGYWLCGGTGAGIAGGIARVSEFQAGRIPHMLCASWRKDLSRGPIGSRTPWADGIKPFLSPVTSTDGIGTGDPNMYIPMGVRIVLRPDVDVDSLTYLQPGEKILVKAIQEYGVTIRDSSNPGGAFAIHMENDTTGDGESFSYTADSSKPWYMTSPMDARWLADCYIADEWDLPIVHDSPATFGQPHH